MTTMVWINVLLAIPFIALWAGIPLWLVLKRPDHQAAPGRDARRPDDAGAARARRVPPRRLTAASGPASAGREARGLPARSLSM